MSNKKAEEIEARDHLRDRISYSRILGSDSRNSNGIRACTAKNAKVLDAGQQLFTEKLLMRIRKSNKLQQA